MIKSVSANMAITDTHLLDQANRQGQKIDKNISTVLTTQSACTLH